MEQIHSFQQLVYLFTCQSESALLYHYEAVLHGMRNFDGRGSIHNPGSTLDRMCASHQAFKELRGTGAAFERDEAVAERCAITLHFQAEQLDKRKIGKVLVHRRFLP